MIWLAGGIATVLVAIATLHLYWGLGGVWPGTDEKSCARAVVGFRGVERMPPPAAALAVAGALVAAALLALALAGVFSSALPPVLLMAGACTAALVFLARGIAGFTPAWRGLAPEMPFARNDVRYFSPLCLALGGGFTVLILQGVLR